MTFNGIFYQRISNIINKSYCTILLQVAKSPVTSRIRTTIYRHLGVKIGKNTYIGTGLNIIDYSVLDHVELGNRVTISDRVTIVVSSSPNNSKLKNIYSRKIGKIVINNDAWIGTGVIILPGVNIGKMTVIGAGAVVTKDIPPFSVAVGVPARVLKRVERGKL